MATDVERARQERATQYWLNCLDHASCAPTMADFAGAEVQRTVGEITARLPEADICEIADLYRIRLAKWIEREFGGVK